MSKLLVPYYKIGIVLDNCPNDSSAEMAYELIQAKLNEVEDVLREMGIDSLTMDMFDKRRVM